jgi:hypothetical protein
MTRCGVPSFAVWFMVNLMFVGVKRWSWIKEFELHTHVTAPRDAGVIVRERKS